ncbi:response regulator [Niabella hibiscisoli]|uniref:response regulator n=1 Tax=Niabella hibiscisoli TaxID=1825928 RepID=UPI001F0F9E5A|nr:response regulator transcription factor [Niabella hibiscisoli]MCH5719623.1 response regulator transcription factor [Niabella hibiscisoli]
MPATAKNTSKAINVLIVDDQQIIIEGLCALLKDVNDINIAGSCSDPLLLMNMVRKYTPDVILMDLNMPGKDGIECTREVLDSYADQKILMLTGYDDIALIREALKNGATGYVLKNIGKDELVKAIQTVAGGTRFLDAHVQDKVIQSFMDTDSNSAENISSNATQALLSKREQEVLKMISEGKKSADIASLLFISINTVDTHRKNILAKCEVKNTAELILFATKNGLI